MKITDGSFSGTGMIKKLIRDKEGIIDSVLLEPESYTSKVKYLIEELPYAENVGVDGLFHIYVLLLQKKMLLF